MTKILYLKRIFFFSPLQGRAMFQFYDFMILVSSNYLFTLCPHDSVLRRMNLEIVSESHLYACAMSMLHVLEISSKTYYS